MVWVDDPEFLIYSEAEIATCETLLVNGLCKEGTKRALMTMRGRGRSRCKSIEQGYHHHHLVNLPPAPNTNLIPHIGDLEVEGPLSETMDLFSWRTGEASLPALPRTSVIHTQCPLCMCKHLVMLLLEVVYGSINTMPNDVTFSVVVNELCREGKITEAHHMLNEMIRRGMKPDAATYNVLMDRYCARSEIDEVLKLHNRMVHNGTIPDRCSYEIFIILYCKNYRMDKAMHLFEQMCREELICEYDTYETLDTLIDGLCTAGELKAARDLLLNLPSVGLEPKVGGYNYMIQWLCNRCLFDEVSELFMDMGENGCSPNDSTYNMIIEAFLQNNETLEGLQLLQEILARGFFIDPSILTLLLKMISDVRLAKQQILHWQSNLRGMDECAWYYV